MNRLEHEIFDRAYQSYLCGSDQYSYKFKSLSENMLKKYKQALKNLSDNELIEIVLISENKAKLTITEKGINYGNNII